MSSIQLKFSPTLAKDLRDAREFGYRDDQEFVYDAIKRRLLDLKKSAFLQSIQRVRRAVVRSGLTEESILEDFRRYSPRV